MKKFTFERTQQVPITLEKAWSFFSDPRNLAKITPTSLDFKIISEVPAVVHEGLVIQYTVKPMLGIPMKWVSLIKSIEEPYQFVDEQLQGPYAYWHHLHTFKAIPGGVETKDIVTYSVPFGILGECIHPYIIRPKLNEIFEFRRKTLIALFGTMPIK